MELTILVAKVLGVYFVVSGLYLIFKGRTLSHLLKDFFDHPAIVYLTGVILIFLSTAYLIEHNIWDGTWQTIITIFAWFALLKGVAYIFIPDAMSEVAIKKHKAFYVFYGIIIVIVGVTLFLAA